MKKVLILGSTGSIGRQCLEVIKKHPDKFKVIGLTYHTNHVLFEQQKKDWHPKFTLCTSEYVIARPKAEAIPSLSSIATGLLRPRCARTRNDISVACPLNYSVLRQADLVINAISGSAGLAPTLEAVLLGKEIYIANKESIILAGPDLLKIAQKTGAKIIPLDSEHHAVKQCLEAKPQSVIKSITLTCSGGPFYGKSKQELVNITPQLAIKHPTWKMGRKISVDSATLLNKGLEIIEAMYLFNLTPDQIKVKINPQSNIHAIVEFTDGLNLAKIAPPDMKIVIEEALTGQTKYPPQPFSKAENYQLLNPQPTDLRGIEFGYKAARAGHQTAKKLCLLNQYAVEQFLKNKISFLDIYSFVSSAFSAESFSEASGAASATASATASSEPALKM